MPAPGLPPNLQWVSEEESKAPDRSWDHRHQRGKIQGSKSGHFMGIHESIVFTPVYFFPVNLSVWFC